MKNTSWIAWIVLLIIAWIAGWSGVAFLLLKKNFLAPDNNASYSVRFGILGTDSSGNNYLAKETAIIPLKYKDSGFRFGIEIASSNDKSFTYHMIIHLAGVPKVATGEAFLNQKPSATMQTAEDEGQGTIVNENWFDPGDPVGDESIDVYVNGTLVKTIKYTVIKDEGQ